MRKTAALRKPAAVAVLRTITLPELGAYCPDEGGVFVGIRKLGGKDFKVFVPAEKESDIAEANWKEAIAKANAFKTKKHQDFVAADRVDLYLAYSHAPDLFKKTWYWSSTPYAGNESYAWIQSFDYGTQYYPHKDFQSRARAVRRLPI